MVAYTSGSSAAAGVDKKSSTLTSAIKHVPVVRLMRITNFCTACPAAEPHCAAPPERRENDAHLLSPNRGVRELPRGSSGRERADHPPAALRRHPLTRLRSAAAAAGPVPARILAVGRNFYCWTAARRAERPLVARWAVRLLAARWAAGSVTDPNH